MLRVFALVASVLRGQSFWVGQFLPQCPQSAAWQRITLAGSHCPSAQSLFCAQDQLLDGSAKVTCHWNLLFDMSLTWWLMAVMKYFFFLKEMNPFFLALYSSLWWYTCQQIANESLLFFCPLKKCLPFLHSRFIISIREVMCNCHLSAVLL